MDTIELAVDGFPLDPSDPDIRFHRELSTWLELENSNRVPVALQFDPASERSRWLPPALRRFAWVRAHAELIAGDRTLDFRIAHLISLLVNRMSLEKAESEVAQEDTFAELASQAAAIEATGAGSMFRSDTAQLLLELAKAGIGPATLHNLHAMLRALSPEDRYARMPELAWNLFLNLEDRDDGERCWSTLVRRELRALKPTKRKPWISLLKLAPIRNAPDAKWEQKARTALDRIGREEWETRVASWVEMFRRGELVALERAGQILLRLMIEMRHVAESPGADRAQAGSRAAAPGRTATGYRATAAAFPPRQSRGVRTTGGIHQTTRLPAGDRRSCARVSRYPARLGYRSAT